MAVSAGETTHGLAPAEISACWAGCRRDPGGCPVHALSRLPA